MASPTSPLLADVSIVPPDAISLLVDASQRPAGTSYTVLAPFRRHVTYYAIGLLHFVHDKTCTLATASTCDLVLRLPTCHAAYEDFQEKMILSFRGHGGFGVV